MALGVAGVADLGGLDNVDGPLERRRAGPVLVGPESKCTLIAGASRRSQVHTAVTDMLVLHRVNVQHCYRDTCVRDLSTCDLCELGVVDTALTSRQPKARCCVRSAGTPALEACLSMQCSHAQQWVLKIVGLSVHLAG